MKWHCWSCEKDFTTFNPEDAPSHCPYGAYTPYVDVGEPNDRQPAPNLNGDHEDVVLYMLIHHGGYACGRTNPNGSLTSIVWYPAGVLPPPPHADARLDALNKLGVALRERT